MANSDVQILSAGTQDAPLDYMIKDTVVLQLKAVQALYTDNGAGGDWLPCVTILSDSGHVIARASDQGVKVTAGSDAEVSFFPGVKHAAAAAAGGGAYAWAANVNGSGGATSQLVNAGTHPASKFQQTFVSDAAVFSFSTTTVLNDTLHVTGNGSFLVWGAAQWDNLVNPALNSILFSPNVYEGFAHTPPLQLSNPTFVSADGLPTTQDYTVMLTTTGGQISYFHVNDTLAAHNVVFSYLTCVYVPA